MVQNKYYLSASSGEEIILESRQTSEQKTKQGREYFDQGNKASIGDRTHNPFLIKLPTFALQDAC